MTVFVDTSAWVAYFAPRDQRHASAVEAFEKLGSEGAKLVTTDYVITETVVRLRQLAGLDPAAEAWEVLESGEKVEVLDVTADQRVAARAIFRKYRQLPLSMVDCTSFVVMKEWGIREALTFDEDFRKAGMVMVPGKAP